MISAWSARHRLVLGQAKVAEKSNEITAIPDLLDLLTLKGAVATIDATREHLSLTVNVRFGCQKEIAKKIKEKEANSLLALKGQSRHAERGRRAVLHRAEISQVRRHGHQSAPDLGKEPRPHRDTHLHSCRRHRLARSAPRLGRLKEHRHACAKSSEARPRVRRASTSPRSGSRRRAAGRSDS